jgi:hypothetical protein
MYFTYSQLWPIVVANAFWKEYVRGESRKWSKTKRFKLPIERDLHFPVGVHMVSEFMK